MSPTRQGLSNEVLRIDFFRRDLERSDSPQDSHPPNHTLQSWVQIPRIKPYLNATTPIMPWQKIMGENWAENVFIYSRLGKLVRMGWVNWVMNYEWYWFWVYRVMGYNEIGSKTSFPKWVVSRLGQLGYKWTRIL